ncbi:hypothetical protein EBGED10_35400 [Bacillus sp. GeD10]|nr:hypothetical protein EBGED10_35400 [Bacillus sp. GeD10]
MTTLISKGEKQRRNTHYQRKKRGSVTWEEHVEEKKEKLAQLEEIMEKTPKSSNKEIAKQMGVSAKTIQRLKKQI